MNGSKLIGLALVAAHWKQFAQDLRMLEKQPEILITNQGYAYIIKRATPEDVARITSDGKVIVINKDDKERKDSLIKTLQTAKKKAVVAWMHLTADKDTPPRQLGDIALVMGHVDIALEHLGVSNLPDEGGGDIRVND
jgi:hypothetical protein